MTLVGWFLLAAATCLFGAVLIAVFALILLLSNWMFRG